MEDLGPNFAKRHLSFTFEVYYGVDHRLYRIRNRVIVSTRRRSVAGLLDLQLMTPHNLVMRLLLLAGAGGIEKNNNRRYRSILEHNNIGYVEVHARDMVRCHIPRDITHCLFFYSHRELDKQFADTILPIIEHHRGIPTFPSFRERWHFDNKVSQAYYAVFDDIPMPQNWVFWDRTSAIDFVESARFPLVMKFANGSASENVALLRSQKEAKRAINRVFYGFVPSGYGVKGATAHQVIKRIKNKIKGYLHHPTFERGYWGIHTQYALFQEFLGRNDHDTRIAIVGDRAFGYRRFNRPNDFRASGGNLIDYDPGNIDPKLVSSAFEISERLGFTSMAYDFIYDDNGNPKTVEYCYKIGTEYVHKCSGTWDRDLNWIDGAVWPETLHLRSLLKRPAIVEPEGLA